MNIINLLNAFPYQPQIKNYAELDDHVSEFEWGASKYAIRYHDDENYLMVYQICDGIYTINEMSILMSKMIKWYIVSEKHGAIN